MGPSVELFRWYFKAFLFIERGEGREKEMERNINVREIQGSVTSRMLPTGDLA